MSSSVSFRITRTAEDLAQTITAISQRLVKLEQRQEALELQLRHLQQDGQQIPDDERAALDGIDRLLQETRDLLDGSVPAQPASAELINPSDSHGGTQDHCETDADATDSLSSHRDFNEEMAA